MAVAIDRLGIPSLENADYLSHLDTDCNDMSTLSSRIDCPSLSESFQSNGTSMMGAETSRRPSLASSRTSYSPAWHSAKSSSVTSPTTPVTGLLGAPFATTHRLKCEQDFDHESVYDMAQFGLADPGIWTDRDPMQDPLPHLTNASAMQLMGALRVSSQSNLCQGYNPYSQSMSMNPSLSRSIFGIEEMVQASATTKEEPLWSEHITSPLQTIVPSAAFQPILTSSPLTKHEPSTPCRRERFTHGMFTSSPFALLSPPIVPSQHDVNDLQYEVAEHTLLASDYGSHQSPSSSDYWTTAITPDRRHGRPTMHRRGYERKRHVGPSCKPRPVGGKSGINCDAIIAQNEFACSYPDCKDKATGNQKRFKRQEHKKRHEKTVHEKDASYKCWVPDCKTLAFSRTDNLKSHLKNTHGKKSANQRNRYVATQDKNSEYFDPDWSGDLSKDGFPIFHSQV